MSVKREKNDYRTYLKESGIKAGEGRQVYTSRETHYRISMIVRLLGNGEITIANLIENMVREYFRTRRDELNRMLNVVPKVES